MSMKWTLGAGMAALLAFGGAFAQDPATAVPAGEKAAPEKPTVEKPGASTAMTPKPARRPVQTPPLVLHWPEIDMDKDGKVSMEDVKRVLPKFDPRRFNALDRNQIGRAHV